MIIHDDDLVVATHGRSFWVLDDVGPLRQVSASVAAEDAHLFKPDTAFRTRMGHFNPRRYPLGENPPSGAILYYYLKEEPKEPAKLELLEGQGKVIRSYTSEEKKKQKAAEECVLRVRLAPNLRRLLSFSFLRWCSNGSLCPGHREVRVWPALWVLPSSSNKELLLRADFRRGDSGAD